MTAILVMGKQRVIAKFKPFDPLNTPVLGIADTAFAGFNRCQIFENPSAT